MKLKEIILKLRAEGKSYKTIVELTGASKGTIAFHCSPKYKEKRQARVATRRKDAVIELKREAGGQCCRCGYSKCLEALDFHHIEPALKIEHVSRLIRELRLREAREEIKKCELLCANCHREVHYLDKESDNRQIKTIRLNAPQIRSVCERCRKEMRERVI